jgi:hypothetical protein
MKAALGLAACVAGAACSEDDHGAHVDATDTATTAEVSGDEATNAAETTAEETAEEATPLGPLANVYPVDPVSTPDLVEVALTHLTSADGTLVGDYARVRSCTPDLARGQKIPYDFNGFEINVTACVPESKAMPGPDGTYRHIVPPASPEANDGRFAELMMYHHMQVIHDYFKDVHGLTDRDEPLDAITNVQAYIELCSQWATIPNAAFIPHEGLAQLPIPVDLGVDGDAIVFSGTDTKDFSFDGSVIYHEYTHAILGATRLSGAFADAQGLNNLPGALNEAYADYFASTTTGDSLVGSYALNDFGSMKVCGFDLGGGGGNQGRDISEMFTCPDDLTAEVHADSSIFSSALWQIRADLGKTDADKIVLLGVLTLTNASDFQAAADATIDAAKEHYGAEAETKVRAAFEARGILGCKRVLPIAKVGARGLPVTLEGIEALSPNPYPAYAPGYMQYSVVVPEGTTKVTLTLDVQAAGGIPGFGGGGGEAKLELAMKAGAAPVNYVYSLAGKATNDSAFTLAVTSGKATWADATVAAGTWTFAIHNKGGAASLAKIRAAFE